MKIKIRKFKFWFFKESHFSYHLATGEEAEKDAREHYTESHINSKRFDIVYTNLKYRIILRIWRAAILFDVY
jgi:hypothetical protein